MSLSKAHRFKPTPFYLSMVFYALSHPSRIHACKRLIDDASEDFMQIRTGQPLSRNAISQHLKVLRDMQIVSSELDGRTMKYQFNDQVSGTVRLIDLLLETAIVFVEEHELLRELATISARHEFNRQGV